MPNNCENDLTIIGSKATLDRMLAECFTDGCPDFAKIIPPPPELDALDVAYEDWQQRAMADHGHLRGDEYRVARAAFVAVHCECPQDWFNHGGYEWRRANWGTKSGAYRPRGFVRDQCFGGDHQIRVTFETAWSSPGVVMKALVERFSDIYVEMLSFECGMAWQRTLVIEPADGDKDRVSQDELFVYRGRRGG